ncbi:hypothetical protein PHJA_001715400 [Phtheirospermum japonicum]|uniref:Uncharacterized protein n=1 Tax=Phtheirospermum japonicum TaxID=374723 RepID=A0A830CBQ3_9LAMI|nr:hypothetical protein PHJA_001715400 [Phtheirospermum japonicum]
MATTGKIIRRSIFTFLQHYQYLTSAPTLLAFPYAASYLLSQSLVSSSYLFPLLHGRLRSLFLAAGFPLSPQLLSLLNLKLSQTILTFLFVSPFTFSFLLLSQASVIVNLLKPAFSLSQTSLFSPLLITRLCSSLLMLAANATCFFFFTLCFNFLYVLGLSSSRGPLLFLSATGAVIYSIVIVNAYIICNLASVSSGMENRGGFISILKASVMIRGSTATALSLAVTMNTALAAVEALFQYRVVRAYRRDSAPNSGLLIIMEGGFIAFLYAAFLVLDTVVGCTFWKSCKKDDHQIDHYFHQIEIQDRDGKCFAQTYKTLDVSP